jgi:hypothetical protein
VGISVQGFEAANLDDLAFRQLRSDQPVETGRSPTSTKIVRTTRYQ